MTAEFGLLGGVEARVCGRRLELGHARQRHVLAALLVDANRSVSRGELVERLWGEDPPQRAHGTLYSYLSRLRGALAPARDVSIGRRSGAYVLTVDPAAVDLHRFRGLVERAAAEEDDARAAALFEEALRLWRGEEHGFPDTPWFNALGARLALDRYAAELDLGDARLRLGRHDALLPGLMARTAEHPLDERLAWQFMLALHRSGRAGDALERYEAIRRRLAEELGADPGDALRTLHRRILTEDPALRAPAPRAARSPARPPVPRQLPAAPALFTGRKRELDELAEALGGTRGEDGGRRAMAVAAIGGAGGIGKTWLALRWAHDHVDRFPDGQLYVDLRGFHPSDEPTRPAAAVRGFLSALGVEPASVPSEPDARTGLFRSLTAERRLLVVLDNARDTEQVVPLLPGSPGCAVLVTSRHRLVGLAGAHGARLIGLDVLPHHEARTLLDRHLGEDRVAAEPGTAAELLERCAGLPLAISLVGAHAAGRPGTPLAALAEPLREAGTRPGAPGAPGAADAGEAAGTLDALDGGALDAGLRRVFTASCRALDEEAARAFRLLGLAPGPDIGLPAAAALLGLEPAGARGPLLRLLAAHLIAEHAPGRFRMHDLTRQYAAERARRMPGGERDAALRRVVDFLLHTAYRADHLMDAYPLPFERGEPEPGCVPLELDGPEAARGWFAAEYEGLLAAQRAAHRRGWHARAWRLAWALDGHQTYHAIGPEHIASWRTALESTRRLGDAVAQALAHRRLGNALLRAGEAAAALTHLGEALARFETSGDPRERAQTLKAMTHAHARNGDPERAEEHAELALGLFRAAGDAVGEARTLNSLGWTQALRGHFDPARGNCERALGLFRSHRHPGGEAATLDSLGYIALRTGDAAGAVGYYRRSLALNNAPGGDPHNAANTLVRLAEAHEALGRRGEADATRRAALDLFMAQHRVTEARRLRERLLPRWDPDGETPRAGPRRRDPDDGS
ncbi:AfsR/SARP family transcriptional regulator [Streptomyces sp. SBT349]|uniref:AfsR/SARP family transcriptional regulator n=1 Tax=Streptomyces sp. SBT349 TaxID=1580539 RepID=UPI0007C7FA0F|nr:BTAD domain-containing putative transcriptional regulator [Streptomyces sp. SBT349]